MGRILLIGVGIFLSLGLALMGLGGCRFSPQPLPEAVYDVRVEAILTGSTLEVSGVELRGGQLIPDQSGHRVQVRLIGINAPDVRQAPWGSAAKKFLEEQLIFRSDSDRSAVLEVDTQVQDQYDRILAYLWKNDTCVNFELVSQGYALSESYFPNIRYETELANAEHEARLLGLGIWDAQNPLRQTPQEFRQQQQ